MKRVRISTLMLLTIIAALAVTLVVQERRAAREIAALRKARSPQIRFDSRFTPTQ